MIIQILYYFFSFFVIWFGADLIIKSVDRIARKVKLSSFSISFFLLGILTSIPEIAVSATAVADHNPEIFVGTLLGGTVTIFLLIIPLLAILGKGIRISHDLSEANIIMTLFVMVVPSSLIIDKKVTNPEGMFLILLYGILFYMIQRKHGIFEHSPQNIMELKAYSFLDMVKMGIGVAFVFISSQNIVSQTVAFSELFHIPTYYISLLILSVGTNLPELSLALRAVLSGKKSIAFGDYLGSAAANTLLFGIFTLMNDGEVLTVNSFFITFLFTALGLILFYFFSKSKRFISVKEGWMLLGVYGLFIVYEMSRVFFRS